MTLSANWREDLARLAGGAAAPVPINGKAAPTQRPSARGAPVASQPAAQMRLAAPAPHAQPQSIADGALANLHAETTILGAILLDNAAHAEAAAKLAPADFFLEANRRIFLRMSGLIDSGRTCDIVTLSAELTRRKEIEAVNGVAYLASLTEGLPRRPVIGEYIRIVKEKARARRTYAQAQSTLARIEANEDINEITADLLANTQAIRADSGAKGRGAIEPDLICLADVDARAVEWLWKPRIALGMIQELVGDTGVGKTSIAMNISALGSRGRLPDGGTIDPFGTIFLTLENPAAEVLRPKFDLMGGDARRFHLLRGTLTDVDGERLKGSITLSDVDQLEKAIRQTGAKLLIVDPVQSFYGAGVEWNHANQTRPILDALGRLTEETRTALLLLRHPTKASGGKATTKGLGSIDQTGAARVSLLAGALPDQPDERVLLCVKSNVGPMARALGYTIDEEGKLIWTGDSSITAFDVLAAPEGPDRKLTEATQWLAEKLRPGSLETREIRDAAEAAGLSWRTIQRAKTALRAVSRKASYGSGWFWFLPESEGGSVQ